MGLHNWQIGELAFENGITMRIAIMQPYFIPYSGYFRLIQSTDLFVAYDCVQFVRRGWLHRNKLHNHKGELDWFTLPLTRTPQDTRISELSFAQDAEQRIVEQFNKFPLFNKPDFLDSELYQCVRNFSRPPVQYIMNLLRLVCERLHIPFNAVLSSELQLPSELKGQDRIIAIAEHFRATEYVNAPGGRDLYDEEAFQAHGIKLRFLADYVGSLQSILPRLFLESNPIISDEIKSQSFGAQR